MIIIFSEWRVCNDKTEYLKEYEGIFTGGK